MKINRRHFVGILYDCILFEYASLVPADKNHTLSLDDLADTFAFVADFYKHNRPLMDVPCDQFITRNQLHTVVGLVDYIEEMEHGVYEIFPRNVELREEAPSFASSSSMRQERRRQERKLGSLVMSSNGGKSGAGHDPFNRSGRSWTADLYSHRRGSHDLHNDTDTDVDDEYSIIIPGLSKTDIQTFLWEYAYMLEDYQDDIATLIRYLRRDEWMMQGSKGSIMMFDWDLEGVQKFSKEYNQNKIRKVELRDQEETRRTREVAQRQQEEWSKQQELIREQEATQRMRATDDFIWKMHKTLAISSSASSEIENLIKNLEMEISEYFGFRYFVALAAVGAFVSGSYTHHSDLDLTLTGSISDITIATLVDALHHFSYESVTVTAANIVEQQATVIPTVITFVDTETGITCHLTLNDPLAIYRSKLIRTYALIEPRFGPVMVALRQLAAQRDLISGSIHQDRHNDAPIGSYALELMLITFLQTEKPPLLPKLQQAPMEGDDRPMKETFVQGVDCSFDHDWRFYEGFGAKNTKSVAELLVDFCRFFGYVFDYESKEVNPRIGEFRWRPDFLKTSSASMIAPTALPVSPLSSSSPLVSSSSTSTSSAAAAEEEASITQGGSTVVFHVMDPFLVGYNATAVCSGELVRAVKECFQEAYGALIEGDINLAFSYRI